MITKSRLCDREVDIEEATIPSADTVKGNVFLLLIVPVKHE